MQEIDYTFDAVNNITGISNAAGVLNNGLGGTYNHNYSYDNSYRLISSHGLWDNNNNSLDYQLSLTYTMDGRIKTKTQSATTLIGGALSNFSYDNHYTYYDNQPHTLKDVIDPANYQHFEWDANGNLTFHEHELNGTQRRLCWDEENRLMAVGDNNYTSYYLYDNAGERTYKLTGLNTMMNINGRWVNFATMDNPTLYTGAYLVAGIQGYTKHYYAGSERVSSAIGLGGLANINDPLSIEKYENWKIKAGSLKDEMSRTINECLKNEYDIKNSLEFLHGMEEAAAGTMDRYFYHPDHLGSSSWITDGKGYAIQHLHYLPFGEDWVDQRNASWSAPYTFSGKEKDVETGYSYFGARYYDSGLSIWLSVDPMSDKYPNLTPYAYCANNPVILVDPDGRDVYIIGSEATQVLARLQEATNLELYFIPDGDGRIGVKKGSKPLNDNDQKLYDAIISDKVDVRVNSDGPTNIHGGSNGGTKDNLETGRIDAFTNVNLTLLSAYEEKHHAPNGSGFMHEITEAYALGLLSIDHDRMNIDPPEMTTVETITYTKGDIFPFKNVEYVPVNPEHYKLYDIAHRNLTGRTTTASDEMKNREKRNFKTPSSKYISK